MKFLDKLDGDQITTIIIIMLVVIAIITVTLTIRSCYLEETQKYLAAGCEKVYIPGRTDVIWTNCKTTLEKIP